MTFTLDILAEQLGAALEGDGSTVITGLAPIESAGPGDITFLANKKYQKHIETTNATAIIVSPETVVTREDLSRLRLQDPYYGFVQVLRLFHPVVRYDAPGIHTQSFVDPSAELGEDVTIAAHAFVGPGARIGRGSVIAEGTVLRNDVVIGEDCLIYPNVTILDRCTVGDRVIIHAGTTIGSDGFGFAPVGDIYEKISQTGNVVIEDDVEIGANSCIDRGTIGPTIIRRGAKLDNLIQIAHNVEVGEHTVVAAQSGISGSTTLGHHVIVAGQAGLVGHIAIGDRVTIGAQSGVSKDLQGEGKMFRGSPAREIHEELRLEAAIRHLPELIRTVQKQEARIAGLEEIVRQQEEALRQHQES
ncbi:MAG: UDP-3-O-(3-hydroxymyristoyl)glucosamine N-acyltransferase [Bacteroidetes bacterium]|nr:UDP-3-O-(3-hydroxymyristoyl)glucosamine N-acyltransferase [Bacteroidota bacterium]